MSLLGLLILAGCQSSTFPEGNIEALNNSSLSVGEVRSIGIFFPADFSTMVVGWQDINLEDLDRSDVVEVQGLKVTGLREGVARMRLSATTVLNSRAESRGYENKVYSVDFTLFVQ